jgi:hypothetical protein
MPMPTYPATHDTANAESLHTFQSLVTDTQTALHPALESLRHMLDHPDRHTIGDLAALTERLTSEMMLFNALVGGPLAQIRADDAPAIDVSIDFLAGFLRDLDTTA